MGEIVIKSIGPPSLHRGRWADLWDRIDALKAGEWVQFDFPSEIQMEQWVIAFRKHKSLYPDDGKIIKRGYSLSETITRRLGAKTFAVGRVSGH